jgi:hypothetical protein
MIIAGTFMSLTNAQPALYVSPDGVYSYQGKTMKKNGETYGYFGTIKVVHLNSEKVIVNFYVCKGAPSYNSGSFIDTLSYINNEATFTGDTTDGQPPCRVVFHFSKKGISADMIAADPNFACGFGHAVDAQGFYKRLPGKLPAKQDLLKSQEEQ